MIVREFNLNAKIVFFPPCEGATNSESPSYRFRSFTGYPAFSAGAVAARLRRSSDSAESLPHEYDNQGPIVRKGHHEDR